MSEFINTIDVIGESELCDLLITRTITELFDDKITTTKDRCFNGCKLLTKVNLPSLSFLKSSSFYHIGLVYADFASITLIQSNVFHICSKFVTLVLRNTKTVCILDNTNAFTGTLIASGTGYIYVPRALLDSYKVATNWSTFANQFRALEDYTVDGTISGKLDESKI